MFIFSPHRHCRIVISQHGQRVRNGRIVRRIDFTAQLQSLLMPDYRILTPMLPLIHRTDIMIRICQLLLVRHRLLLADLHALFIVLQGFIEIIQIDIDNPDIIQDVRMQFRVIDIMDIHTVFSQAEVVERLGVLRVFTVDIRQMIISFHDIFVGRMRLPFPHADSCVVIPDCGLIICELHSQIRMQAVRLRQQCLTSIIRRTLAD